ncbi:unnamed protein product [Staurois parvus]|uniref:Transposase n=1 Tax=Staurois parvus TaxID=386267 RepID=A0ABN9GQQ8_9NEOB|nr:unnamed protein product [Staurois parvus]
MGHSQELSEFKRDTVIGCHLCNKSIHEMSLLQNISTPTVSGIITKWKQLGKTANQPRSERGHQMLKHTVRRSCQLQSQ